MRQLSWPAFVWVERRPGGSRKQDRFHILPIENIDKRRQTTPFSGRSQTLRAQVTTINSRQRQVCINRAKKSVGCGFESHTTHFIRWSAACGPALTILVSLFFRFSPSGHPGRRLVREMPLEGVRSEPLPDGVPLRGTHANSPVLTGTPRYSAASSAGQRLTVQGLPRWRASPDTRRPPWWSFCPGHPRQPR
jgi:hypothetical protein